MIERRINIVRNIDWTTIFIYFILVFIGWCNIYAAVYNEGHRNIFDVSQRYGMQMIWIMAAFLVAFIVLITDLKVYTFFAYFIYGFFILLLVMVLIFGREINGNKAWLFIGKLSIQPSEFAKVATSLAIAKFLGANNVKVLITRSLLSLGFLIGLPMLLILLEPDVGSLLVYFAFVLVLFREGLPGVILLLGFVFVLLLFTSLLYSKDLLAAVIIAVGFIAFALYTRKYKETFIGLLILTFSILIIYGIIKLMHRHIDYYFILSASFILSGLTYIILSFLQRIKFVPIFVLFSNLFNIFYLFGKLCISSCSRATSATKNEYFTWDRKRSARQWL